MARNMPLAREHRLAPELGSFASIELQYRVFIVIQAFLQCLMCQSYYCNGLVYFVPVKRLAANSVPVGSRSSDGILLAQTEYRERTSPVRARISVRECFQNENCSGFAAL